MILPPLVMDVRVSEANRRSFRVWLPLFLLWPLLLIIVGFALIVALIIDIVLLLAGARYHHYTLLVIGTVRLLAETRGTTAHIRGHDANIVDVEIY